MLQWSGERAANNINAHLLVVIFQRLRKTIKRLACAKNGNTAARKNAFLYGRATRVKSIFNTGLLLLHFNFGGRTDIDLRNAAGEFGKTFLQLLAVVIAGGIFHLTLDLLNATLNVLGLACAFNKRASVLGHRDLFRATKLCKREVFKRHAEFFHHCFTANKRGNVAEHFLATITKTWRLDSADFKNATKFVHHKCGKRFAVNVFGNN